MPVGVASTDNMREQVCRKWRAKEYVWNPTRSAPSMPSNSCFRAKRIFVLIYAIPNTNRDISLTGQAAEKLRAREWYMEEESDNRTRESFP